VTAAVLLFVGLWLVTRPGTGLAGTLVLLCSLSSCGTAP
jgi:hypothetical protein